MGTGWALRRRHAVIVDNDWSGDPDGLVALAHHALSPADGVVAVTATANNPMFGDQTGKAHLAASYARELLEVIGEHEDVPVVAGPDHPFTGAVRENAAARALVDAVHAAAMTEPSGDVVLVCGGALTNVADALLLDPSIGERMRLAWVGGTLAPLGSEPAEFEYNRATDEAAAAFVHAQPHLRIDRFPRETYASIAVSVAETEVALTGSGRVGVWLWRKYLELALPPQADVDPVWPLGDNAPLAVTALPHPSATFVPDGETPGRRVCTGLDGRLILGDLFARLRLHEAAACADRIGQSWV